MIPKGTAEKVGQGTSTPEPGIFDENPLIQRTVEHRLRDGRKVIGGVPERRYEPDDLWKSVVDAGVKKMLISDQDEPDGRKITEGSDGDGQIGQESGEGFPIENVDLNVQENGQLHHTDRFCAMKEEKGLLVVRRGQEFRIKIQFTQGFQADFSKVVFELGHPPVESQSTRSCFQWEFNRKISNDNGWSLELKKTPQTSNAVVDMRVVSPAYAPIGQWTIKLQTQSTDGLKPAAGNSYPIAQFILLYNPWIKSDAVFLGSQLHIEEYLLQDVGPIWKGTQQSKHKIDWVFGQFEENVLENTISVLEECGLAFPLRADPILLCRAIAEIISSTDPPGVLAANFTNIFSQKSHPTLFTGSPEILNEFALYGRPVRYGQCWVFAGVMCTSRWTDFIQRKTHDNFFGCALVMRCLGIACRVVTTYNSAHDLEHKDANIHFSKETGNILRNYSSDIIWNFHVWNECWMARPDLPKGHGGWQAVNPTALHTSEKKLECVGRTGPAPVHAILDPHSNFSFDTAIFHRKINASKRYWVVDEVKNEATLVRTEESTGVQAVTKAVGENGLRDITSNYKHQNVSEGKGNAERGKIADRFIWCKRRGLNMFRPLSQKLPDSAPCPLPAHANADEMVGGIRASVDLSEASVMLGEDIVLVLKLANIEPEDRSVDIKFRVGACLYTGSPGKNVLTAEHELIIKSAQEKFFKYVIKQEDYIEKMLDQGFFHVKLFVLVKEPGQMLAKTSSFCLRRPEIEIEVENMDIGKRVTLKFWNPTILELKHCRFILEGAGLTSGKSVALNDMGPGSQTEAVVEIFPWGSGKLTLVARFSSDKIVDIHGSCMIDMAVA